MAKPGSHPDDGGALSDEERRAWQDLAGQLERPGAGSNPRDYEPAEDDDGFVPPEPDAPATPLRQRAPWLVLAASLALLVWLAYARAPWGFALLAVAASAWALLTLVRRLPQERGEQPPEV